MTNNFFQQNWIKDPRNDPFNFNIITLSVWNKARDEQRECLQKYFAHELQAEQNACETCARTNVI